MATAFKNTITKNLGTTPVSVLTTNSTTRGTIIGLSLANLTKDAVTVSVTLTDNGVIPAITGYYLKDVIIPPNQTLRAVNGGEKLLVAINNDLQVVSNTSASVDVITSYVEIT